MAVQLKTQLDTKAWCSTARMLVVRPLGADKKLGFQVCWDEVSAWPHKMMCSLGGSCFTCMNWEGTCEGGCGSTNTGSAYFHSMSLFAPCSGFLDILFLGWQCIWLSAVSKCYASFLHVRTSKFCLVVCHLLSRWQTSFLIPSKLFQCWIKM